VTALPLAIRGGTLVDQSGLRRTDLVIADGRIRQVGDAGDVVRVLDATGCFVLPGLVDIQVHFRTPGGEESENLESGARAAALGGVTACLMMPNTTPAIDSVEMVEQLRSRTRGLPCDLHLSATVTVGRLGEQLCDLAALHAAGVRVFTDDGSAVADPELMAAALRATTRLPGSVISQHAEDPKRVADGVMHDGVVSRRLGRVGRPREAEDLIVARDLELARISGGRYHVLHVSTAGSADLIREARASGVRVTAEVTPQHLLLTDTDVGSLGTSGKMNPPLREPSDLEALRIAVRDGTIDAIATDHAPHHRRLKDLPFDQAPPGMLGVETAAAVVFSELVAPGHLSVQRAAELLSWGPARIAGIVDHGHPLDVGSPANLTVIDPDTSWVVRGHRLASRSDNTPWEGRRLTARVRHTVLRGEVVVLDGVLCDRSS